MPRESLIEKAKNKAGTYFGLWRDDENGTFFVTKRCANYAGHVRGGIAYVWRLDADRMDEAMARELYERRLKGKAR